MNMTSLAEQVVLDVHGAVGSMYPLSSVGHEEVNEIVRKAVATTLFRIIGTSIGTGGVRQVDAKLRDLAQHVSDSVLVDCQSEQEV